MRSMYVCMNIYVCVCILTTNEFKLGYLPVGCSLTSSRYLVQRNQSEVGPISSTSTWWMGSCSRKGLTRSPFTWKVVGFIKSDILDYKRANPTRFEVSRKKMQLGIIQDFLATGKIFPKDTLVMDPLHFVLVLLRQVIGNILEFFQLR